MDDGIEGAAQQGTDAFEAQQVANPVPAPPPASIGPSAQPGIPHMPQNDLFSRPHFMERGWYVTADRMWWWNGMMWIRGRPPGSSNADGVSPPGSPIIPSPAAQLAFFLAALAIMAAIGYVAWQAFQAMPTGPPMP